MLTQPTQELHASGDFDIRAYGAIGDGIRKETLAIQAAIDACNTAGGGRVVVPAGDFLTGPIYLRSHVELHLMKGATLLGSEEIDDYQEWTSGRIHTSAAPYNARYLLISEGEENIAITGEGTIDGQGKAHYELSGNGQKEAWWAIRDRATRPGRMIWLIHCRNVRIQDGTFCGSPAWTFWLVACQNVYIHNIHVIGDWQAINTDGIDIDCCTDVLISHSTFQTGDDCIVLRAIDRLHDHPLPCERVHVENCELQSHCNAIRFAYLRDGTIRNISFQNVTIHNSRRGVICQIPNPGQTPEKNFHIPLGEGPCIENLSFENLHIEALQPLWFHLSDDSSARRLANLTFKNVTLIGSAPSQFKGTRATPFQNIAFQNIRFESVESEKPSPLAYGMQPTARALMLKHCENFSLSNITLPDPAAQPLLPNLHSEEVVNLTLDAIIEGKSQSVYSERARVNC